jgi:hypothetical protein
MNRRNLTTTGMIVTAGLLLYGGVALAREQQPREDRGSQIVAPAATDDRAGATSTPELEPTASPDDHGGTRTGSDDKAAPTASPDDKGGTRTGSDDKAAPTASPDDKGGSGGSGSGSDDKAAPTASPDDHGGHGSDG